MDNSDVVCTHWSSMSNNWLKTSWLKKSADCVDWFWVIVVRKELSLHDSKDEGSLSLQRDIISWSWFLFYFNATISTKQKSILWSGFVEKQNFLICSSNMVRCQQTLYEMMCQAEIWPPSQWKKGGGVLLAAIHEEKSACIMLNICSTHNGDYAPFRQRHFDLLPWNITPASEPGPPLFLLKWRTLQSETAGIPPTVYMIALPPLLVCVQLDEPGRWVDVAAIIWSWHYFRFWNSPTLCDEGY